MLISLFLSTIPLQLPVLQLRILFSRRMWIGYLIVCSHSHDPYPSWPITAARGEPAERAGRAIQASLVEGSAPTCLEAAVILFLLKKPSSLHIFFVVNNSQSLVCHSWARCSSAQWRLNFRDFQSIDPFQSGFKPRSEVEAVFGSVMDELCWELNRQIWLCWLEFFGAYHQVRDELHHSGSDPSCTF